MKTAYIFPIGLVAVLLILGGVYYFNTKQSDQRLVPPTPVDTVATSTTTTTTTTTTTKTPGTYTMADVAAHSGKTSCWTTIEGSVYDLTSWISRHPGGETAILSICGKDGTKAFEGQHSGQTKPEQMLASFKIGVLAS